jgi:hypothetical protein
MEINVYNKYHNGDIIFNLMILNKFEKFNFKINFYINPNFKYQINDFITNNNIKLLDIRNIPQNSYDLWIGNINSPANYFYNIEKYNKQYDQFYINFFKYIVDLFENHFDLKLNINPEFKLDIDFLDLPKEMYFHEIISNEFKDIDILFLNNQPYSDQYKYDKEEFDILGIYLSKKYKIASICYINDLIPCTLKYKYKLIHISIISKFCKYIIGINSAPAVSCFTEENINSNKFYLYDINSTYTFNNAKNHKNINEIYKLF